MDKKERNWIQYSFFAQMCTVFRNIYILEKGCSAFYVSTTATFKQNRDPGVLIFDQVFTNSKTNLQKE